MIVFSQTCYSLRHSAEGYLFALLATVLMIFFRDEPLEEHEFLGFDCPTIHDSSVDHCVEVAVVTLMDCSLETP